MSATLYIHGDTHHGGTVLAKQTDDECDFLEFVETELKKKRLDRSNHGELRIYANIETSEGIGGLSY